MMKWKNSPQKKLQEGATANELIKNCFSNITKHEFKIIVIKLIAGLENGIQDSRESIATEIRGLRTSHEELKSAINEVQSNMQVTTARNEEAQRRIGELKDKIMEKEEAEKKRDKKKSRSVRGRIRELSDAMKHNNLRIIGIPEEEEREKGAEGVLEQNIAENFPDLGKEKGTEIQEAQRTPFRRNLNRSSARRIIAKLAKYKDKDKILKAARDKRTLIYKGSPIRLLIDLSTEPWQARKEWQEIFNVMNRKNIQLRILYPASLSFRQEGETKVFPNKQKLKEFITTKPALQEILRGIL
uniref:L1 transposable element RRM domain-containing protein n=1 Tax=Panthera leo TaxID=9689 RepID=A0A8C9D9S9_PANLE